VHCAGTRRNALSTNKSSEKKTSWFDVCNFIRIHTYPHFLLSAEICIKYRGNFKSRSSFKEKLENHAGFVRCGFRKKQEPEFPPAPRHER
jgi:hypothetical protein